MFLFGTLAHSQSRYFNPTIIHRPDGDWLIARHSIPGPKGHPLERIGMNNLEAFRVNDGMKLSHHTKVQFPRRNRDEHFEDPRAFWFAGRLCISCTNFQVVRSLPFCGTHQIFAVVGDDWKVVMRTDPIYGRNGASLYVQRGHEKNWGWFEYHSDLQMVYTIIPHQVAVFDRTLKATDTYATNVLEVPWKHGTLRGGTPPTLVGDEYWSFFHSSVPWSGKKRRYHMGAYAFSAKPPFHITRMTSTPLLSGSQRDPWAPGLPLVVFPGGALLRDGKWLVVFGVNDFACGWIEIPHAELEPLLESAESEELNACVDVSGQPMTRQGRPIEKEMVAA